MKTTLADFIRLAADHTLVPVVKELMADTETPVSVLRRFCDRDNVFLLESVEGGETWGRYSFVGIDPEPLFAADHAGPAILSAVALATVEAPGVPAIAPGATAGGALDALRTVYRNERPAVIPGLPRFIGGAVGFLGYEAAGEFEKLPPPKRHEGAPRPLSRFVRADQLIVFDNLRHTIKIIVCARPAGAAGPAKAYEQAMARIEAIEATLHRPVADLRPAAFEPVSFASNMSPDEYQAMVRRAKEYIVAGDIIQAVLSQRFSARTAVPSFQLYRALRFLNPSPYLFFLKMGGQALVGSSPEVMVRLGGSRVELRPIAGTRPRGDTEQEDRRLADELLSDEKEKAEHVMLVDLGRNDLGRVAETGSVQVREYMTIERYSHVMHIVSHVECILRKDCDALDVLRATFPAGTLSGAPKIRAMEIIHELEPGPRGVYGGAVGYIGYDGNMDFAITIRTMEITNHTVSVQAGAGIVYNSEPQKEFEETCHKARGMQKAVELAARGLALDDAAPGAGGKPS